MEVRSVDLAKWALWTSPKFTTGVKFDCHINLKMCIVVKRYTRWSDETHKNTDVINFCKLILSIPGYVISVAT